MNAPCRVAKRRAPRHAPPAVCAVFRSAVDWLGFTARRRAFPSCSWFGVPDFVPVSKELAEAIKPWHELSAYAMAGLVVVHVPQRSSTRSLTATACCNACCPASAETTTEPVCTAKPALSSLPTSLAGPIPLRSFRKKFPPTSFPHWPWAPLCSPNPPWPSKAGHRQERSAVHRTPDGCALDGHFKKFDAQVAFDLPSWPPARSPSR